MKLQIVIPAYNEQEGIEHTIRRSLEAREFIVANSPVTEVAVTVVSDGSTDRTVELARPFVGQIRLLVFDRNRGYGAAIQEGWNQSDADLLGFLDADGTCDPRFFSDLCRALEAQKADVVLGSRLNPESRMPAVRRIGNRFFAALLSGFSGVSVRDAASGMRVVRRKSLPGLLPLPDGLNFTPAMTARALMRGGTKVVEVDMSYSERRGVSKLSVAKDGVRFLKSIVDMIFLYQPWRPLFISAVLLFAVAIGLMLTPVSSYIEKRSVEEWMIYRFIISHLAGTGALLMLSTAYVTNRIAQIALRGKGRQGAMTRALSKPVFAFIPLVLMGAGIALVMPGVVKLGATYEHWSRFIAMSFFVSAALVTLATWAAHYVLELLAAQLDYLRSDAAKSFGEARSSTSGPSVVTSDMETFLDDSSGTSHAHGPG